MSDNDLFPKWMDRKTAARYLSRSPGTLAVWATLKRNLRYYKNGRRVLYNRDDLDRFVQGGEIHEASHTTRP
jgi:Helix-turn-helix domain